MSLRTLYGAAPGDVAGYDTPKLRAAFLVEDLFVPDSVAMLYTHLDRLLLVGAVPVQQTLEIGSGAEIGTPYLLTAREMGIANLGGPGTVVVDGVAFALGNRDVLYVGRGAQSMALSSDSPTHPARFYMNAVPAAASYPHRLITKQQAKPLELGDTRRANKRRLAMYIHPEVAPSCLLMMGITDLAEGSVWNTMPPHLHERRMEAYCYFDLAAEDRIIHLMGQPEETRHLLAKNGDVVLSPAWSIHMGAGTGPYAFVWGMTGENQHYTDVAPVALGDLR